MLQAKARTITSDMLDLAFGRYRGEDESNARNLQLTCACVLGALLLSAFWGVAAGSGALPLAAANTFKVPLVILLSALCALPTGLLALRLTGSTYRSSDLVLGFSSGIFAGTLVLAVLAPLVAVYYHTSAVVGSKLATASAFTALAVGVMVFVRNAMARASQNAHWAVSVAAVVLLTVHLAAMLQFIAIASPILPDPSAFDGGVDTLLHR